MNSSRTSCRMSFRRKDGSSSRESWRSVQLVGTGWYTGSDFSGANPNYDLFTVVNTTPSNPNTWAVTNNAAFVTFQSKLTSGATYFIISRSTDLAGNVEFSTSAVPGGAGVNVTYNIVAPTATITQPLSTLKGVRPPISTISGTSSDLIKVSSVSIAIFS